MFILNGSLNKNIIAEIDFPNQVSIKISLKGQTVEKLLATISLYRWIVCICWFLSRELNWVLCSCLSIIFQGCSFAVVKALCHIVVLPNYIVDDLLCLVHQPNWLWLWRSVSCLLQAFWLFCVWKNCQILICAQWLDFQVVVQRWVKLQNWICWFLWFFDR